MKDGIIVFERELRQLEEKHLFRRLTTVDSYQGPRVVINGKSMLLLCSNDYLGLAGHPALRRAACEAVERYGFGSGASRFVSGTSTIHEELEQELARFKNAESALVFNSGYAANTGIIPAVAGTGDVILSDSLNHASIIDGCRLSKAEVLVYRHKDLDHVEKLLKSRFQAGRRLIVTDGIFSMDGDIAPLPGLVALAEKYDAVIMVDDAHATGVLGKTGKGTADHFGLSGRVHIQIGTLGKALGSFGAYVAGSRDLIDLLVNRARSLLYSTAVPPAVCAASLAALDIVEKQPDLMTKLWRNRERLVKGLQSLGVSTGDSETPIIPLIIGDSERAMRVADKLIEGGIYVAAIRPPTVQEGSARIRTTVMASHSDENIDTVLDRVRRLKQEGYM
jgi:8-amino-7-oxononanoate synthase